MVTSREVPTHKPRQQHRIVQKQIKGGASMSHGAYYGGGFALIVVLFILLIIVGAAWY